MGSCITGSKDWDNFMEHLAPSLTGKLPLPLALDRTANGILLVLGSVSALAERECGERAAIVGQDLNPLDTPAAACVLHLISFIVAIFSIMAISNTSQR